MHPAVEPARKRRSGNGGSVDAGTGNGGNGGTADDGRTGTGHRRGMLRRLLRAVLPASPAPRFSTTWTWPWQIQNLPALDLRRDGERLWVGDQLHEGRPGVRKRFPARRLYPGRVRDADGVKPQGAGHVGVVGVRHVHALDAGSGKNGHLPASLMASASSTTLAGSCTSAAGRKAAGAGVGAAACNPAMSPGSVTTATPLSATALCITRGAYSAVLMSSE